MSRKLNRLRKLISCTVQKAEVVCRQLDWWLCVMQRRKSISNHDVHNTTAYLQALKHNILKVCHSNSRNILIFQRRDSHQTLNRSLETKFLLLIKQNFSYCIFCGLFFNFSFSKNIVVWSFWWILRSSIRPLIIWLHLS